MKQIQDSSLLRRYTPSISISKFVFNVVAGVPKDRSAFSFRVKQVPGFLTLMMKSGMIVGNVSKYLPEDTP
jgi:hypothetical protein